MYAISNGYKNLIENSLSLSPKSKIVVDNVEYTGAVLKSYPKISHKTTNMIGGFPTKTCSFEIYDINNNLDFEGKEIIVYRGLEVNGTIEWIPQGIFIPTADKITTNISTKTIAFNSIQDKSQLFDSVYTTNLTWLDGSTHTGLEIVQDICNTLGITLETTTFNWYNYGFKQPNFPSNITYREVINRLAEIGGGIAYISRTGGLVIKGQNLTSHSVARSRYGKLSKEKQFGPINVVVLGKDGVDDDIIYPNTLPSNVVEWKILDNPFVDLYREEMIETVANYIIGQSIIPFELSDFVDGFYLDLNDAIQVTDKNGNTFNATLLSYESTSRIKSTVGAETQNNTSTNYNLAGSNKETIRQVKNEVDHINGTITQIVSEIGDRSEKTTSITQDIDTISQQVSESVTLTKEITQNTSLTIEDAFEGDLLKFNIVGEMSLLYPSDDLYPSDNLYPLDSFLIIEDEEGNQNKLFLPLTYLHYWNVNVYDEFVVENGNVKIIRRVGVNDDGSYYALTTPVEEDKGKLNIPVTNGYNKIWLESFYDKTLRYYIKYVYQNDYTEVFATRLEVGSAITQTSSSIMQEVGAQFEDVNGELQDVNASLELKLNTDDLTTEINAHADEIHLDGYVTMSNLENAGETSINGANITTGIIRSVNYSSGSGIEINLNTGSVNTNEGIAFGGTGSFRTYVASNGDLFANKITVRNDLDGSDFVVMYQTEMTVNGNLTVTGTKNRLVTTENYGKRLLNAYETATPYFGDIGSDKTDENGYCKIEIEDIFKETIELDNYKVFIQECGEGYLYVKKYAEYFEVHGTPNLEFDWEIKALQKGYSTTRLEERKEINEKN